MKDITYRWCNHHASVWASALQLDDGKLVRSSSGWRHHPNKAGPRGYRSLWIDGRQYRAHRLAFALYHGEWPVGNVDHIDGDPSRNTIDNLRDSTQSQNIANSRMRSTNSSGYKGVIWDRSRGRWQARIKVNYKTIHLGRFDHKAKLTATQRMLANPRPLTSPTRGRLLAKTLTDSRALLRPQAVKTPKKG